MKKDNSKIWELGLILVFIGLFFFLVQTNANETLGSTFIGLTLLGGIMVIADYMFGNISIPLINPNRSWIMAITIAVIGYITVVFGGNLAIKLLSGIPISDTLGLLQASVPVFSNSYIINFLAFGFAIATVETFTIFVASYDLLLSMFNVDINNKTSIKHWLIVAGLVILFIILHATAKQLDNPSLIIVGWMALVSVVIVMFTKEARTAILLHILLNVGSLVFGG
jgi:hypothetical protein